MNRLFWFSCLILSVFVVSGAALGSSALVHIEDDAPSAEEPVPPVPQLVKYDLETLSPTPQYPVAFSFFDGSSYWYNTECCQSDGHVGIYPSPDEIHKLGCNIADPVDMGTGPMMMFSGPGLPNQIIDFSFAVSPNFATAPQPAVFSPLEPGQTVVSDFYGNANPLNTAVRLKGADGQLRYFSLVRFRHAGTWANANGEAQNYEYEFLVLMRPRTSASFRQFVAGGDPGAPAKEETVLPTNQIHPDGFPVTAIGDWSAGFGKVVEIRLPPSTGAPMQNVKVLVFNRVLP